jgi:Serpentine type 7TM GPCR chemoreceptor Srx
LSPFTFEISFLQQIVIQTRPQEKLLELYVSINYCFFLVLINLQVCMSLDRVYAIYFPMLYMVRKNDNYKSVMIAFAIVAGLIGGLGRFYIYYYETIIEYRSYDFEENQLKYMIFYSLWTFGAVVAIITCNSIILYSIKVRVRNSVN